MCAQGVVQHVTNKSHSWWLEVTGMWEFLALLSQSLKFFKIKSFLKRRIRLCLEDKVWAPEQAASGRRGEASVQADLPVAADPAEAREGVSVDVERPPVGS